MPGLTTRLKLPWAQLEEDSDIEQAVKPLAESLDASMLVTIGTGAPPAQPQPAGNCYLNTNTGILLVSTGTAWLPIMTGSILPVGGMTAYGGTADPVDGDGIVRWKICNGDPVQRTSYTTLFSLIGTTYGAGDGSTTFNLPDLRGRVPVGADSSANRLDALDAIGNAGGEQKHLLAATESGMPGHAHTAASGAMSANAVHGHQPVGGSLGIPYSTDNGVWAIGHDGAAQYAMPNPSTGINLTNTDHTHAITVNQAAAAAAAVDHNNMQPYQVVNYIIKVR